MSEWDEWRAQEKAAKQHYKDLAQEYNDKKEEVDAKFEGKEDQALFQMKIQRKAMDKEIDRIGDEMDENKIEHHNNHTLEVKYYFLNFLKKILTKFLRAFYRVMIIVRLPVLMMITR